MWPKILDSIFVAFNFGLPFDRHFWFFAEVSVDALERAAAGDAEYKFADGSSSPANTIIVGVGWTRTPAYRGRSDLRSDLLRVYARRSRLRAFN